MINTTSGEKNMERAYAAIIILFCLSSQSEGRECDGWFAYQDNICIKTFHEFRTYDQAKTFCEQKSASLVMVKESGIQDLIVNQTHNIIYDNLWLGGKCNSESGICKWEDGELLTYTNWLESYPKNTTDSAIEFRPLETMVSPNVVGKWADVSRLKRNLVMCQRKVAWTLEKAVDEILRLRKEFQEEKQELHEKDNELEFTNLVLRETVEQLEKQSKTLKKQLDQVKSKNTQPVGFIYVEYYNQPSPKELWPSLSWQDVTSTYAGLFFRAFDNTESWGSVQKECAPQITEMQFQGTHAMDDNDNPYSYGINLTNNGWSDYAFGGLSISTLPPGAKWWYEGQRFYTEQCEVRPKNQAIRMWKRIE